MYSKKQAILSRIWKDSIDRSFIQQRQQETDQVAALQKENVTNQWNSIHQEWQISYKGVSHKPTKPVKRSLYQDLIQVRTESPLFTFKKGKTLESNYSSYQQNYSSCQYNNYSYPQQVQGNSHQTQTNIHQTQANSHQMQVNPNVNALNLQHSNQFKSRYHVDAPVRKITLRRFHSELAIGSSASSISSISPTARKPGVIVMQRRRKERSEDEDHIRRQSHIQQERSRYAQQNKPKQHERLHNIRKQLNQIYLNRNNRNHQTKLKLL